MEDARRWGLDLDASDLTPEAATGVWRGNLAAVEAFLAVQTQWRMTGAGMGGVLAIGLDYGGVETGLRLAGITATPGLWTEIRIIEAGATEAMNGGR